MIYLKLFLSFLQIGMFSFGGGYAAMPLIQEQVVTQHGWLTMTEFTDLITISRDDTWADCDQCGNICRQQNCRSVRICCGDLWVHSAVLYYRNFDRMVLFKI